MVHIRLVLRSEPRLEERIVHGLARGNVLEKWIFVQSHVLLEIHHFDIAETAAFQPKKNPAIDATATLVTAPVAILVLVRSENSVDGSHGADSVGDDDDLVATAAHTHILRRVGSEVGVPREIIDTRREFHPYDVGHGGDATVFSGERGCVLPGGNVPVLVVKSHCCGFQGTLLCAHALSPSLFLRVLDDLGENSPVTTIQL
jgi:hypothetical protein